MKRLWTNVVMMAAVAALSTTVGFAAEPAAPPKAAKPAVAKAKADAPKQQEQVDINSATAAELKTIPGLGDAYISQIIAKRPYANKSQLVSRKVLPEAVYEKVKDRIIAKQAQTGAKKTPTKSEAKKK